MTRIGKSRTKTGGREGPFFFLFFPKVILSRLCDNCFFYTQGTYCILRVNQTSYRLLFFPRIVGIPGNCAFQPSNPPPPYPSHLKQPFTNKDAELVQVDLINLTEQRGPRRGPRTGELLQIVLPSIVPSVLLLLLHVCTRRFSRLALQYFPHLPLALPPPLL